MIGQNPPTVRLGHFDSWPFRWPGYAMVVWIGEDGQVKVGNQPPAIQASGSEAQQQEQSSKR